MAQQTDLAIVGAGIMGLAHAYEAARAGLSVRVFDREPYAQGASVRNFGMLAVIAQSTGVALDSARRNLASWQFVAQSAGIELKNSGCLFLAREPEEQCVLKEFAAMTAEAGRETKIVTRNALHDFALDLRVDELLCGAWSPEAWKVDQRQASSKMAKWLHDAYGVSFHFSTEVTGVETSRIVTTEGEFVAKHTLICGGNEFSTLFPDSFRDTNVTQCQLQMLRTAPQPKEWHMSPFIVGGLSLSRYSAFASCPGLPDLVSLQEDKYQAHLAHGIHVIACQEADGSVTIGDSHAYGADVSSRRVEAVDRLILEYLEGMISLPNMKIAERWLGQYAHLPGSETLRISPMENVSAVTMTNGQGMTHAFSVAADVISELEQV